MKVSSEPPANVVSAFSQQAENQGTSIEDVAFSISVATTNLQSGVDIIRSFVNLKVSRGWAEKRDIRNIRVFRLSDSGQTEILPTSFIGYDDFGQA